MTRPEPAGAGTAEDALFPRATLFQVGQFFLHSGQATNWKIECDALTAEDWRGLARMAVESIPKFRSVAGVPRGGIPLAEAIHASFSHGASDAPRLIVDDVLTTGQSILERMTEPTDIGLVVFARGPLPPRVTALFAMPSAITAAESRAMERCAKIAETFPLTVMPRPGILFSATFSDIASAIRSSINPPGEEE